MHATRPPDPVPSADNTHGGRPPRQQVWRVPRWAPLVVLLPAIGNPGHASAGDEAAGVEFVEKRTPPILVDHCYNCQGRGEAAARLRLDSKAAW